MGVDVGVWIYKCPCGCVLVSPCVCGPTRAPTCAQTPARPHVCMYGAIWTHGCFGQGLGLTPSKTLAPARGAQGVPAPSPLLSGGAGSLSSHRSPSPLTAAPWSSVLGLRGGGVKTNQGCEETGAACGRGATAAQAGVGAGDERMERWGQQCPPPGSTKCGERRGAGAGRTPCIPSGGPHPTAAPSSVPSCHPVIG